MKKLFLTLVAIVLTVVPAWGQTIILLPTDALGFDYSDTDLTNFQVSKFQAVWDISAPNGTSTWIDVPATGGFQTGGTLPGSSTYKIIPPFTNGNHVVVLRTCNAAGCGVNSVPFSFAFAVSSAPATAPSNVRKIPR